MATTTKKPRSRARSEPKAAPAAERATLPAGAIAYDAHSTPEGLWEALEAAGVSAWINPGEGVVVLVSEGRHVMGPHEYVYEAGGWHVGCEPAVGRSKA